MRVRATKQPRRAAPPAATRRCVFFAELSPSDAGAKEEPDKAVWVQVALEGSYDGYEGGSFKFEKSTFDTIVANFREHPSFELGVDGIGAKDVVPWDFHHASELGPTSGTVPVMGAPAQGWVRDLKVTAGENGAELWALTRWLEPARTYVLEGKYRWASVTVHFAARDALSGKQKGPTLLSIALTNKPFIEGMQELVAAERQFGELMTHPENLRLSYNESLGIYIEPAKDAENALTQLRRVFGLPATATAGDVLAQIMTIQGWVASGGQPLGVDVGSLVGCMRTIFGLPALSSNEDVFLEASKLIQALIEQESEPANAGNGNIAPPAPAAVATERTTMELLKKLAEIYGVAQNETAVLEAARNQNHFVSNMVAKLALTPHVALTVALDKGTSAIDKLGAIVSALGVENPEAAIAALADKIKQAKALTDVMPELESLRDYQAKAQEKEADADVAEAMASYDIPEQLRPALTLTRKGKDGKAELEKIYPKKVTASASAAAPGAAPNSAALLLSSLAALPGGTERRVVQNPDGSVTLSAPGARAPGANPNAVVINLTGMPGRTRTERMLAYVRSQAGDKVASMSHDDIFDRALELLHSKNVQIVDVVAA